MTQFTGRTTVLFELLTADQFALNGRTQVYWPIAAKVTGADRYQAQTWILSAALSAQAISMTPLGVSAPAILTVLVTDQPVDVRTNAASDTVFLSGTRVFVFTGALSNLFITTGSAVTTIHTECVGGSNATLTANLPMG